jgi:hypothetical protein
MDYLQTQDQWKDLIPLGSAALAFLGVLISALVAFLTM